MSCLYTTRWRRDPSVIWWWASRRKAKNGSRHILITPPNTSNVQIICDTDKRVVCKAYWEHNHVLNIPAITCKVFFQVNRSIKQLLLVITSQNSSFCPQIILSTDHIGV